MNVCIVYIVLINYVCTRVVYDDYNKSGINEIISLQLLPTIIIIILFIINVKY
jgi:hypothetical protein